MELQLENLTKRFGQRMAVNIPSLTIRAGEFFTLVGPSGSGKSTILNLIAGLEEPATGSIRLGGTELTDLPPQKRNIAFVFQSYALYPHRTVRGNLAFPLEMARLDRPEIARRIEETAGLLGLAPHLDKLPRQLSGGERQRVALGRAIVRQPQLFLFDEPLSNLDAPLRAQMRRELKRLHRQLGSTFIYVTHDQDEALSLPDRIAILREGSLQQCAAPEQIYNAPANRFVASFFGMPPMNILPARLEQDGAAWRLRLGDHGLPVALRPESDLRPGAVTMGIRPEHLRFSATSDGPGIAAEIVSAEMHGALAFLETMILSSELRLTVCATEPPPRPGERGRLLLPPEHIFLFDAETGNRLNMVAS